MAVSKKFLEAVSQDAALKAELDKAVAEAVSKVAEAHGFAADEAETVSNDELAAVAGGRRRFDSDGSSESGSCACPYNGYGVSLL